MDLAIVIPVFNEAESIVPLIDEIADCLPAHSGYEIIVVDDGSTDTTLVELSLCRNIYPQLRVVHHQLRCGQSRAIATGVDAAKKDWIITLDGDGQNDPADIMQFFQVMDQASDNIRLIVGYRKQRRDTWLKRVSSRIANAVRSFILEDRIPDTGCGLKMFARETFIKLPYFDNMHRFLPALVQRQGGQVMSIEVNHRERNRGKSKYGVHDRLWVGIIDMLGVLWLRRRMKRPLVTEIR